MLPTQRLLLSQHFHSISHYNRPRTMKLQLSVFAEGLVVNNDDKCRPYAIIETTTTTTEYSSSKKKQLLGRTETLLSPTCDPDWAKIFVIEDFQLGRPLEATVTIYNSRTSSSSSTSNATATAATAATTATTTITTTTNDDDAVLCRTTFDVGTVMGTKGGILGKETKSGAIIMMQVERCSSSSGILEFQFRAKDLKHRQGEQVDPFFEIQRRRRTSDGKTVWDCVYRSKPVVNNPNPTWDWSCIELSVLCQAKLDRKFRVAIKHFDYEYDKKPTLIGYFRPSVNDLLLSPDKEFIITKKKTKGKKDNNDGKDGDAKKQEVGKVIVMSASVTATCCSSRSSSDRSRSTTKQMNCGDESTHDDDDEEEEIFVEATNEMDLVSDGFSSEGGPTFADYIAGGCELRVTVAIDFTVSNGDPRQESSLHHFKAKKLDYNNGDADRQEDMNDYDRAIFSICSVLSEFDSDQKFPVRGFGARLHKGGDVSHCFPCGGVDEVDGVMGILDAYHQTIRGGIGMSKPTDITHVIASAAKDAKDRLDAALKEKRHEYSILAIFTNGNILNIEETLSALKKVEDSPLSIVVVGVGPSTFDDMHFLDDHPRVKFVDMKAVDGGSGNGLAEQTLRTIPDQLVSYFVSRDIKPNAPLETDEIFIEPFSEENVGTGDEPTQEPQGDEAASTADQQPTDKKAELYKQVKQHGMRQVMRQGRRLIDQQKRKIFGRCGGRPPTNQQTFDKLMDTQVNKLMNVFK